MADLGRLGLGLTTTAVVDDLVELRLLLIELELGAKRHQALTLEDNV